MGRLDHKPKINAALGLAICVLLAPGAEIRAESAAEGPIRHARPYSQPQEPTSFLNIGAGVFDPTDQPGDGFYGVIAGGTELAKQVDLGVQLSWYHRSTNGAQYLSSYVDPAGNVVRRTVQTNAYDTDLVPFMGFARYRFPTSATIQPYIGGGIGYEWLSVSAPGAVFVDPYGYPYYVDVGTSYGGFGGMAFAGMNFVVTPTASFYAEAAYNWSTVSADYYDPYYAVTIRESINMDGAGFQGGLKFRF